MLFEQIKSTKELQCTSQDLFFGAINKSTEVAFICFFVIWCENFQRFQFVLVIIFLTKHLACFFLLKIKKPNVKQTLGNTVISINDVCAIIKLFGLHFTEIILKSSDLNELKKKKRKIENGSLLATKSTAFEYLCRAKSLWISHRFYTFF